jgi:hypothetical protein
MNNGMTTQQTTQAQTLRSDIEVVCDAASPIDGGKYEVASLDTLTITWMQGGRVETVAWEQDGAVHISGDRTHDHREVIDRLESLGVPVDIHGPQARGDDQCDLDRVADAIETIGYSTSIDSGEVTVREPEGGRRLVRLNRTYPSALADTIVPTDLSRIIEAHGWSTPMGDMGAMLTDETDYEVDSAEGLILLRDGGDLVAICDPMARQIGLESGADASDRRRLETLEDEHGVTVEPDPAPAPIAAE